MREKDFHKDPYRILQVSEDAETDVIEAAYRRLARKYHPDVNCSPNALHRMQEINWAYEILGNPAKRRTYDLYKGLRRQPQQPSQSSSAASQPERDRPRGEHDISRPQGGMEQEDAEPSIFAAFLVGLIFVALLTGTLLAALVIIAFYQSDTAGLLVTSIGLPVILFSTVGLAVREFRPENADLGDYIVVSLMFLVPVLNLFVVCWAGKSLLRWRSGYRSRKVHAWR